MVIGWIGVVTGSLFLVLVLTIMLVRGKSWLDPTVWRNVAIGSIAIMSIILLALTVDSLSQLGVGRGRVPPFTVINHTISYSYDGDRRHYVPEVGDPVGFFGKIWSAEEAGSLLDTGKKTIQGRNCMGCHTLLGNGAYYAPDLTKAWLDPKWETMIMPITDAPTKEEAMVIWLQSPQRYPTWGRRMPDLQLSDHEARAVVAYLKFMAAIDTNGFPDHFGVSASP